MAVREQALAAFQEGQLSLKDFEWEAHLRPSPSSSSAAAAAALLIPEIDLQPLYDHGYLEDYATLLSSLSRAASTFGFFHVFNHGIPLSALQALSSYQRTFFSLPLDRKYEIGQLLRLPPSAGPSGFLCGSPSLNPNKWWSESLRAAFTNHDTLRLLALSLFPLDLHEQQAFCDVMKETSTRFAKLAQDITLVLLEGLGLKGKEVVEKCIEDEEIACFQWNHYPPCPQPNMTLGISPHFDVSILTLLWQDQVGGLQVHMEREWVTVKPRHDALVVNIGDVFQIWSNDHYQSGLHRAVLNTSQSRYSLAYFHNIGVDPMLSPIPELLERTKESAKFRSTSISKHRDYVRSGIMERVLEGVNHLRC